MYLKLLRKIKDNKKQFSQKELKLLIPKVSYFAKEGNLDMLKAILKVIPEDERMFFYRLAFQMACHWYQKDVIRGLKEDVHTLLRQYDASPSNYVGLFLGSNALESFYDPIKAGRLDVGKEIIDLITLNGRYPEACEGFESYFGIQTRSVIKEGDIKGLKNLLSILNLLPNRESIEQKSFTGNFLWAIGGTGDDFAYLIKTGKEDMAAAIINALKCEDVKKQALDQCHKLGKNNIEENLKEDEIQHKKIHLQPNACYNELSTRVVGELESIPSDDPRRVCREQTPSPELYDKILPWIEFESFISNSYFIQPHNPYSWHVNHGRDIIEYMEEAAFAAQWLTTFFDNEKDISAYLVTEVLEFLRQEKSKMASPIDNMSNLRLPLYGDKLPKEWNRKLWAPLIRDNGLKNVLPFLKRSKRIETYVKSQKKKFPKTLEELKKVSKKASSIRSRKTASVSLLSKKSLIH